MLIYKNIAIKKKTLTIFEKNGNTVFLRISVFIPKINYILKTHTLTMHPSNVLT